MRCWRHGGGRRCRQCGRSCGQWLRMLEREGVESAAGEARALCARCAVAKGLKAEHVPASKEACRLFCMLNALSPGEPPIEHMHLDVERAHWEGEEVEGLAAPRDCRPDGVQCDGSGRVVRCWFYHGCAWHGYPPHDHRHHLPLAAKGSNAELSSEAYAHTMADMACFTANGLEVRYIWSIDFDMFSKVARRRQRPASELMSIVYSLDE